MCAPAFLLPSSSFKSAVGEEKTQLLAAGDFFHRFGSSPEVRGGEMDVQTKNLHFFLGVGCDCVA